MFIHPCSDGHLGAFQYWAVTTKVAMSIHVQAFVWTYASVFYGYILRSAITGLYIW